MWTPDLPVTFPSWLHLPRTARLRLTALYAVLILLSSAALLAITYLLVDRAISPKPLPARAAQIAAPPHPPPLKVFGNAVAHQQINSDLNQLLIQSGIALAIIAVVGVVLGWLVAGRVLRPVQTITSTARRISASNLHERLALQGPDDELKDLADTLDDLFARLEASFEAQRHFVASASHELRTPLTAERTLLQVALADPSTTTEEWRSTAREVLASSDEQEHLIEALLALASSEGGLDHRESVDLASVTEAILLRRQPEMNRLGLRADTQLTPARLAGDPGLIDRLVTNLVDNAVRHNVQGGQVQITTESDHLRATLSVSNTGPVIPPNDVDRLFQPFQRLDPRRTHRKNGHGLGLSIVRAIAEAHGATIDSRCRPEGGMRVRVSFPPPGILDEREAAACESQTRPPVLVQGRERSPQR